MYRVVLILVLCGLLAQAYPYAETGPVKDLNIENLFERTGTNKDSAATTAHKSWSDSVKGQWSSFGQFFDRAMKNLRCWFEDCSEAEESGVTADTRDQPEYEELCRPDVPFGYEARSYNRSVWLSLKVVARFPDVAVIDARPRLLAYFEGENERNLTIDMTKPLRLKSPVPTGQWGPGYQDKTLVYSMYLPEELYGDLPSPNDKDLYFSDEPPSKYFAIVFSSYTFDFMNFQKLGQLEDLLNTNEERFARGYYFVNVYDPPQHVTNRRNEVMLMFNPDIDQPVCSGKGSVEPIVSSVSRWDSAQHAGAPLVTTAGPDFKQLCRATRAYDARLYSRAVWVSTKVSSLTSDIGGLVAYTKLDNFFNKFNNQGKLIPKTTPIRITQPWPKSVYDPVYSTPYTFSYYLPETLYENIPQPLDPDVYITDEPAGVYFALNFTGYTYDYQDKQKLNTLENRLIKAGEQFMSSEPWATNMYYLPNQYSDRRNDVIVKMDPLAKHPVCETKSGFPPCRHRDKECPSYRVLETLTSDVERRHVAGGLYAVRRTETCVMDDAYDEAYMPLHKYFRGANVQNMTIQRVPPVLLFHKSTANPPAGCNFTYVLMFYMPSERHLDAPSPTDENVELKWIGESNGFFLTFEESATEAVVEAQVTRLRSVLDTLGFCYNKQEYGIASYDATWRPRPHRREIWIAQTDCITSSQVASVETYVQFNGCDDKTVCAAYETVQAYDSFSERIYGQSVWVCKETSSCDVESAFTEAIDPLQEYYQDLYNVKDQPKSRPVTSFLSLVDFFSTECSKTIQTCMYLPGLESEPLVKPSNGLTLETNLWRAAYVAGVEGEPTSVNVETSMSTLMQGIVAADLIHSGEVFVAMYTLPNERGERQIEVGALTETLSYNV